MKLDDFKEKLEQKKYDEVFEEISDKAIELIKKVADLKNIYIEWNSEKYDLFYTIKFRFEDQSAQFRSVPLYAYLLLNWYCEDDFHSEIDKIKIYINCYNSVNAEYKQYLRIKDEIEQASDYEKLKQKKEEELIKVFKEMLEYKNKKYDENWRFDRFIEELLKYYNYYSEDLCNTREALIYGMVTLDIEKEPIETNEIENIMYLEDLYNCLTFEGDDYKNYADFYRDFELKEGQTYSDLYDEELEKFREKFKEMLDFLKIEYKPEEDFEDLQLKITEAYPYYLERLMHLTTSNPNVTYIEILDHMETVYDSIKEDYKNHEENMKRYEERKKREEEEGEDEFLW